MNSFAVNLADAAPDAAAAAIATAVEHALRPRFATVPDALHSWFARARERVSSTRASGPIRIDLDPPERRSRGGLEIIAHEAWAEPSVEEPERWDGMS